MMKKLSLSVLCAVLAVAGTLNAGDYKSFKEKVVVVPEVCNFSDTELQVDAFFTGVAGEYNSGHTLNSGVGGGTGVNFFFARYFGLGVEAFWYGNGGTAEHMIVGNAYFRYPICSWNLAPYIMAGGGAGWDGYAIGYGHVGGGIEWRPFRHVGFFGDARWFYGAPDNVAVFRSGVRIAFH